MLGFFFFRRANLDFWCYRCCCHGCSGRRGDVNCLGLDRRSVVAGGVAPIGGGARLPPFSVTGATGGADTAAGLTLLIRATGGATGVLSAAGGVFAWIVGAGISATASGGGAGVTAFAVTGAGGVTGVADGATL